MPERLISFDCRYFLGDRPCVWHKRSGARCECEHYERVTSRVLLIKLDAMGDVLRTTALLPAIAAAHPGAAITWATRSESVPLLTANPYISEVVAYGPDLLTLLGSRVFDRVINLDAGKVSAGLASIARATQKDGYVLNEAGQVTPTNVSARHWLELGVFDDLKRAGQRTYQDVMLDILGLAGQRHGYVLELSESERQEGRQHLVSAGLAAERPVVGLNTGAGGRWALKQWREDGFLELIAALAPEGVQFVLLGGPAEQERNQRLVARSTHSLIDPGCQNPVRLFAALTSCCDVVVTGDTLAMHIALALSVRTIVLFGPTSAPEIELYGLGEKLLPDMTCLACYKNSCDFVPNCMDLITSAEVIAAVKRQLTLARRVGAITARSF
jgi:ADP-heptose:LPS heptosyltransferase